MDELSQAAADLAELVNENLNQLEGKCQEEDEMQDYYLGMLSRQTILLQDLSKILTNRNERLVTTPFIILRCILDDFLHLLYLELHEDTADQITNLNAKSHKLEFKSLKDLTVTNHKYHNGEYPFYLNNEQFQELKITFSTKAKNKKYFSDIEGFKFKSFPNLSQVVNLINGSENINTIKDRVFYLWNDFSTFVHYANFAFYLEMNPHPINSNKISEAFFYCFNSIYLVFKHFERNLGLEFIDSKNLTAKYTIAYEC